MNETRWQYEVTGYDPKRESNVTHGFTLGSLAITTARRMIMQGMQNVTIGITFVGEPFPNEHE